MKTILKTLPAENGMKYDERFTSDSNNEILRKLIPELMKAMRPRYSPSYSQLRNWLQALHRHRRSRYNYRKNGKLDKDNCRLHSNSRLNEVHFLLKLFTIY